MMNRNKYGNLVFNTFIFALGNIGSKLISFFLVPLYTNVLSTAEYGTADLIMSCANIIIPIAGLVIQDAVLRFGLSKENNIGSVLKNAFFVFLGGSIFIIICTPLISMYAPLSDWGLYLTVISITNMANTIMFTYAKAKEKNVLYAAMSIVHTLVLVALNILLLVVWKTGVEGYLIANIAGNVIPTIILFFATGAYKEVITAPFDKKLLVNMLKFSIPLVANNLSWWVLNSSDKVMIEAALSASDLGIYTAASKIPALLSIVTSIFSQAWTVSSIKEYDSDKDKSFYATVFKYFSIVMFFGATFVILILKPFMQVYVGMDFYSAWIYVPALLLGSVFFSFGSFFGAIYGALRKNSAVAFTTILAAVINIVINLIFIPVIGVAAAAISTAVSYIVMGLIRMLHSRKYYKFEINFVQFALNAVLITAEIILIMLGQNIYIVASAALILLTIINFRDLAGIKNWMFAFVKQKFSRGRKKHEG